MSFTDEFGKGFAAYGEANRVLFKHGLFKYMVIPAIVSLVYAVLYFMGANWLSGRFTDYGDDLPWYLSWLGSAAEWAIWAIFWAAAIAFFMITYKMVAQIVLSPFLSQLSEAVAEKEFGGAPVKTGWAEAIKDIQRSFVLSLRNLFREVFFGLAVSLIPGVGSLVAMGVSGYYSGFNFMDYTMERHRMTIAQSVAFTRKHRGLATGIGLACNLGMSIPVIGWMIMPTYATIASTIVTCRIIGNATGAAAVR
jgi:CysZ protein